MLLSSAFLPPAIGRAQLSWETRQIDFRPTGTEPAVSGDFEFTNSGTRPVTIVEVKSSCGCTTTALAKKTYASQEKGKITATFTIGERQGFQQKQIMVTTDDQEEPYTQLTVRVFIPELLRMEPAALQWTVGGVNGARVVKLAGVFILAGVLKLREPDAFAASVATFRVLPRDWSNVVALGLPVLEVMCGLLLFAPAWRRAAALGLAVLSALFTVLLLQGLGRGLNVDCGCFGKWDPAAGHPVVAVVRDLVFLALEGFCYREFR